MLAGGPAGPHEIEGVRIGVVAALRVAASLGPDARVVTLMCDSGLESLSTDVHGKR